MLTSEGEVAACCGRVATVMFVETGEAADSAIEDVMDGPRDGPEAPTFADAAGGGARDIAIEPGDSP